MYRPREIATRLSAALADMPVVVLTGMRQTGKSTLLQHEHGLAQRRYVSLDDLDQLQSARADPQAFVAGAEPLTIDEVQRCPELLVAIKREVDRDRRPGRFILSGSANLAMLRAVSESLAGRALYLPLLPFTRREIHGNEVDDWIVDRLFAGEAIDTRDEAEPIRSDEITRGGMPPVCLGEVRAPATWFTGYEQTYLERDLRELSQVADLVSFRRLLRLTALRTAQVLNQSDLARDAKLNAATTSRYLSLLETSFLIVRVPPFLANPASRLVKSPKVYIADSGLACHLTGVEHLGASDEQPMRGALFETYVAHQLAAALAARRGRDQLCFWNIQGRHEVDFVIESNRDCIAIEVKAAARWTSHDLAGLRNFLSHTPRCRAAVLAYNGKVTAALGDKLWAIPLSRLVA